MLCDWTIGYEIEEHQRRSPTVHELSLVNRQRDAISKADLVVSLFPRSAQLIARDCPDTDVRYFGLPANVVGDIAPNLDRSGSRHVIFVGRPSYKESLRVVVSGLDEFNALHPDSPLDLDVIGMGEGALSANSNVRYHGYLRKDVPEDRELYYHLLTSARALITVSDRWVGASSIVEAMALGTPAIVSPNPELEAMLGEPVWGRWCGFSDSDVAASLEWLASLSADKMGGVCRAASDAVRGFTWEHFVHAWCDAVGFDTEG